jgi:hypothetical protein
MLNEVGQAIFSITFIAATTVHQQAGMRHFGVSRFYYNPNAVG